MSSPPHDLALALLPASEQQRLLRGREISCRTLIEAHIDAIERFDPALNAVVTRTFESALRQAERVDRRRSLAAGRLAGLAVVHKDTIATKGVRTTFGSPLFADHVPEQDALIVERMRRAGAIMLGKSNVPELAAGSQTYNPVFGATRNPYDARLTCGGSSGGAAVALSCGMTTLATGTDLGGSLRNPASFCNVVGIRPSPGLVPIWPPADSFDPFAVQGPMGRTVEDVALQLRVIAGANPRAPMSASARLGSLASLARDMRGTRIAWSRSLGGLPVEAAVTEVLERNRPVLGQLGCLVEDLEPDLSGADEAFCAWRGWLFELSWGPLYDADRDRLGADIGWNIEVGRRLTAADLARATRRREALCARMQAFFTRYDYLVAPVVQVLPFPVEQPYPKAVAGVESTSYIDWMKSCYLISAAGLPAVSVPFGFTDDGLPVGLQVIAANGRDWDALALAHAIERETQCWRRHPPAVSEALGEPLASRAGGN